MRYRVTAQHPTTGTFFVGWIAATDAYEAIGLALTGAGSAIPKGSRLFIAETLTDQQLLARRKPAGGAR